MATTRNDVRDTVHGKDHRLALHVRVAEYPRLKRRRLGNCKFLELFQVHPGFPSLSTRK